MKRAIVALLAISTLAMGCAATTAQGRAQVATQASLTAMAEGVNAGSGMVVDLMPRYADAIAEQLIEAVRSGEISMAEAIQIYDSAMAPWNQAIEAFGYAREVLHLGQSAVDVWISTGELPQYWGRFCDNIGGALQRAFALLEACGVEIPEALEAAVRLAPTVCEAVAQYVVSGD